MPVCSGCPHAGSNPQRGFMFNGLPKHCRDRYATPHGVVGAAASSTATDREPLTGFGGVFGNVHALHIWKPRRAWAGCGNEPVAVLPKSTTTSAMPKPSSSTTSPSVACSIRDRRHAPPCLHRRQPPCLRHPHWADGQHGAGGGDGERGGSSPSGDAYL